MKKLETKDKELNLFVLFLVSSEEKNAAVYSDRRHNDGKAEDKAVKEIAMVRSRIAVQVIQQYSRFQGIQNADTEGGEQHMTPKAF